MKKRELAALFVCSMAPWMVGSGLIPLLPVYATELGAGPAIAGAYLAFSYFGLGVGNFLAGWVSDNLHRRKLPLIIGGVVSVPATWLMGQVTTVWGLTLMTAVLWFCGGLGLALISILAGLSAGEDERGRIFGILSITGSLGAVLGGLGAGYITNRWGYTTTFTVEALFLVLWPLSGLLLTEKNTASYGEQRHFI
jgi:MFS family permease